MNQFVESKLEKNEIFSYKDKSHFTRFLIVYYFTLKNSIKLLFHYKISKKVFSKERIFRIEEKLFSRLGKDCKILFLKLGGVYIKLGQFLSNMAHFLPESFIKELIDLQDRIPPHKLEDIKIRFKKETSTNLDEIFPNFPERPIASASTAQVYKVRLLEQVLVVKILYPEIEKLVKKDLETVLFVMKRINRYLISFDYKLVHSEIKETILNEMDLSLEAKSLEKMSTYFSEYKEDYVFPEVIHEYSTKGVLVTTFIEGVKITETKSIEINENFSRPLDLLVRAYLLMIFKFRFYHADPHSGNLIYTPDGKLAFIDFGAVNFVQEVTADSLRKIISSATSKDYYGVIEGMQEMGFFDPDVDKLKLEKIAKFALDKFERFIKNVEFFKNISLEQINPAEAFEFLKGINSSLSDLLKIAKVPRNYVMLERTMSLLMGNIAVIDPKRNIFDYSNKYFKDIVLNEVGFIDKIISEEGSEILSTSFQIPKELHKALLTLNRGRLEVINKDIERQTDKFYALGHQFISTAILISSIYFGNYFYKEAIESISAFFYTVSSFSLFLLVKSILKNRF